MFMDCPTPGKNFFPKNFTKLRLTLLFIKSVNKSQLALTEEKCRWIEISQSVFSKHS